MQGGPDTVTGVREGDVLAGKYRIETILGMGGMGVVVAARHLQLETKVAIKFLLPHMLSNQEAITRFVREARAAVKITNEHVARVLDVGTLDTGAPYMVMEFLEGGDLAAWLRQSGPLPVELAAEFILQVCVALAEAHSLGIVHRDLKPSNLFCIRRPDGQFSIKVLDFGISKLIDVTGSGPGMAVTRTATLMGSPLYMSPEQMRSAKDADIQSDIWALGVILYELLTGRVPFEGDTITEVALKVATQPAVPPTMLRSDLPPALEGVLITCLEKDRRHRYRNVAELALALAEFAPKRARGSVERIVGTVRAAGAYHGAAQLPPPPESEANISPGTMSPLGRTTRAGASKKKTVVGIGAAGALVVAVIVGLMLLRHKIEEPLAAPTSAAAPSAQRLEPSEPPPPPPALETSQLPTADSVVAPTPMLSSKPNQPSPAPSGHPAPRSSAAARARPSAISAPNCDPSYTLDEQGRKHFKPECFLKNPP